MTTTKKLTHGNSIVGDLKQKDLLKEVLGNRSYDRKFFNALVKTSAVTLDSASKQAERVGASELKNTKK